jgi:UPF0042 nucleotide-binding protein
MITRHSVVVITGMSGAGKTTALHTLEDLGFFCVDNLPTVLAPQAVAACEEGGMLRVALGIDVRVRSFLASVSRVLAELEDGRRDVQVLFFDASDEALLRRFSESRRPHPMNAQQLAAESGSNDAFAVLDGVRLERERLAPLRASATRVYDTTHLSVHDLRRQIVSQFGPAKGGAPQMLTRIVSFGFKYGVPADADVVLDVRFLENPYFIPELKPLPGTDPRIRDFVLGLPEASEFLTRTQQLLEFVMPRYEREGKSYLTVAIGCTGGRHRSVVLAEALATELVKTRNNGIAVVHRDVARGDAPAPPSERLSSAELKGVVNPPPSSHEMPAARPVSSSAIGKPGGKR